MADLERIIAIIFEGDDRSAAAFSSVDSGLGKIGTNIENAAGKLATLSDYIIKADAVLAALAVGGLAVAITKAGDFNTATSEIATLIDDTNFSLGEFRREIINYASDSTKSIGDITGALYSAVSATGDWENSIGSLTTAEQLSVAGRASLNDSLLLLARVMNSYGAGTDQATRYANAFFMAVKLGLTTLPELSTSLAGLTSITSTLNIPIETVTAAVADLTSKGASTSEAMTMLEGIMRAFIVPSGQAANEAERLEVAFGASAIQGKGFEQALMDVYNATGGNVEKLGLFFGRIESLNGVLKLAGTDGFATFLDKLNQTRNAIDPVSTAHKKMVDEVDNANQKLKNSFDTTFIAVGSRLSGDYITLVGNLSDLFKGLQISLDAGAFDPIFDALHDLGKDLSDAIGDIAENLPEALDQVDFEGFVDALGDLGEAISGYLGGLDLTTPEGLADALQKVVDVITGLITITSGMVDTFKPFVLQIGDFIIAVADGDEKAQKFVAGLLAVSTVISNAGIEIAAAMISLQNSGVDFEDIFNRAMGAAGFAVTGIKLFYDNMNLTFSTLALTAYQILDIFNAGFGQDWIDDNINKLKNMQDSIRDSIKDNADDIKDYFSLMVKGSSDIKDAGDNATDSIDKLGLSATGTADDVTDLADEVKGIPDEKSTAFGLTGVEGAKSALSGVGGEIDSIPDEKDVDVSATANTASITAAKGAIDRDIPDARKVDVSTSANTASITAAKGAIDKDIPATKDVGIGVTPPATTDMSNIKTDLDDVAKDRTANIALKTDASELDNLKGQLSLMQSQFEWEAKLDIAEVEANATVLEALAGAIGAAFASSGDIISSAVSALADLSQDVVDLTGNRNFIKNVIQSELDLRQRAMAATEALVSTQIEYMNSKIAAMERGDALIQIDGAGLQPHLEAFMWEILSAVQVRVNEEGHAMLFGL